MLNKKSSESKDLSTKKKGLATKFRDLIGVRNVNTQLFDYFYSVISYG